MTELMSCICETEEGLAYECVNCHKVVFLGFNKNPPVLCRGCGLCENDMNKSMDFVRGRFK